jgi:hypothetical protein
MSPWRDKIILDNHQGHGIYFKGDGRLTMALDEIKITRAITGWRI